ncbi:hypothetical protein [Undibacterium sp. WLHG33]
MKIQNAVSLLLIVLRHITRENGLLNDDHGDKDQALLNKRIALIAY